MDQKFKVTGMSCLAYSARVEKAVKNMLMRPECSYPGVVPINLLIWGQVSLVESRLTI